VTHFLLGLRVNIRRRSSGEVAVDDTVREVSGTGVTGRPPSSEPGLLLYVMVDSVERTLERIAEARGCDGNAFDRAGFRDPAGSVLGIGQQPQPSRSSAAPRRISTSIRQSLTTSIRQSSPSGVARKFAAAIFTPSQCPQRHAIYSIAKRRGVWFVEARPRR
jgi:hypothetical protein